MEPLGMKAKFFYINVYDLKYNAKYEIIYGNYVWLMTFTPVPFPLFPMSHPLT